MVNTIKTHLAIGLASVSTSVLIIQMAGTKLLTPLEFCVSLAVSVSASVLPDIDIDKSKPREVMNKLVKLIIIGLIAGLGYSIYHKIDLWNLETIKDTISRFWVIKLENVLSALNKFKHTPPFIGQNS